MREPISQEAAESYADIRGKEPQRLYSEGTRGRVSQGELTGENRLYTRIALQLAREITDVGLAALGESGLLQLAKRVVDELDDETVTAWTKTVDAQNEPFGQYRVIPYVFLEFDRTEIRQLAEVQVASQFGVDVDEESPLSELLGEAKFFRDRDNDDPDPPSDDRYEERDENEREPVRGKFC